jgi:hypothetical protein
MPELRIFDSRPGSPHSRVHLSSLIRALLDVRPDLGVSPWSVVASYGTGPNVADLEDAIDTGKPEIVLGDLLRRLQPEDEFWDAEFVNADHAMGIFDSSWLFLRGPGELVDAVARRFERTEIAE